MSELGLGRVKTSPGMMARADGHWFGTEPLPHALMASISGLSGATFVNGVSGYDVRERGQQQFETAANRFAHANRVPTRAVFLSAAEHYARLMLRCE